MQQRSLPSNHQTQYSHADREELRRLTTQRYNHLKGRRTVKERSTPHGKVGQSVPRRESRVVRRCRTSRSNIVPPKSLPRQRRRAAFVPRRPKGTPSTTQVRRPVPPAVSQGIPFFKHGRRVLQLHRRITHLGTRVVRLNTLSVGRHRSLGRQLSTRGRSLSSDVTSGGARLGRLNTAILGLERSNRLRRVKFCSCGGPTRSSISLRSGLTTGQRTRGRRIGGGATIRIASGFAFGGSTTGNEGFLGSVSHVTLDLCGTRTRGYIGAIGTNGLRASVTQLGQYSSQVSQFKRFVSLHVA